MVPICRRTTATAALVSCLLCTSHAFSTRRPAVASTQKRTTTSLQWSPMDEQSPTDKVKRTLVLTGTGVEVTRAIIMGHLSTQELTENVALYLHSIVANFDLQHLIVWAPIFVGHAVLWDMLSNPPTNYRENKEPYSRGEYDPALAAQYYKRHPYLVVQRLSEILKLSHKFILHMLIDKYISGNELKNRPKRAQELLKLMTQLGPTAIKVGQALSVRPDLIPQEFSDALATLQDQVPPFENVKARNILQDELGPENAQPFRGFESKGPVASASIGQVYKVKLDNGQTVAVKVQRPNVLAEIALDLYITREYLAPFYKFVVGASTDLKGLANEWGRGFIAELDYRREASNTIRFNNDMIKRNIKSVCAPTVLQKYSTERILVTEWVQGVRIDQSDASDIPRLCSVALDAYLVMLLELNSLHCDPHPGNLLRTDDGKLVILDFGMTLEIDPSLQYSLLEYVAHLSSNNYDQLPEDLAKLGFLKPEKLEFARRSGVLEPLKYFLQQMGQGGGAQRFRERIMTEYRQKYPGKSDEELRVAMRTEMQDHVKNVADRESVTTGITMEVEELQRQNRDAFQVPEWFLYTSRAFLTLEGVSLQADPDYSLIKSCFPYVAKRLVGDDDPRAQQALKDMLYGTGQNIDPKRVSDLVDGFSAYTTITKSMNKRQPSNVERGELILNSDGTHIIPKKNPKETIKETEAVITLAKDSADILLNPKGNLVQNLLVEESVLAASARFKDDLRKSVMEGPERLRESIPFGSLLPPFPFERHIRKQLEPFVRKTVAENNAQQLAERMVKLQVDSKQTQRPDPRILLTTLRDMDPEHAALLIKEIRENLPKYAPLVGQLGGKFASTLLKTASFNIETTLMELEQAGQTTDHMLRVAAKGLSNAAQRGSSAFAGKDRNQNPFDGSVGRPQARIAPVADLGTNSTMF